MGLLKDIIVGQTKVTPDRALEPRHTGKTIFTNREPVPLVQRIAMVLFSVGWLFLTFFMFAFLRRNFPRSIRHTIADIFLVLLGGCWAVVCFLALCGLPPFQSRHR